MRKKLNNETGLSLIEEGNERAGKGGRMSGLSRIESVIEKKKMHLELPKLESTPKSLEAAIRLGHMKSLKNI